MYCKLFSLLIWCEKWTLTANIHDAEFFYCKIKNTMPFNVKKYITLWIKSRYMLESIVKNINVLKNIYSEWFEYSFSVVLTRTSCVSFVFFPYKWLIFTCSIVVVIVQMLIFFKVLYSIVFTNSSRKPHNLCNWRIKALQSFF